MSLKALCVCVCVLALVCDLSMFIYAPMHKCVCAFMCVFVRVWMHVCISRAVGSTDAPSQWTQWITYRPLSQTWLQWPLVYPTLIGPSAEGTLPSPLLYRQVTRCLSTTVGFNCWLKTSGCWQLSVWICLCVTTDVKLHASDKTTSDVTMCAEVQEMVSCWCVGVW